jgi:ferrous iron transport protein A
MPIKPLSELKPGEKGRIVRISGEGGIHRRLLDMGLVAESEVEVERVAPLGDPIEVRIKGSHLALRREEAANIQVEVAQLMPLPMVSPGEVVQVADIRGGWGPTRKLANMGLLPGTNIRVISNWMPGPLVVEVKGTRLALGYGMAQKILVTEVESA